MPKNCTIPGYTSHVCKVGCEGISFHHLLFDSTQRDQWLSSMGMAVLDNTRICIHLNLASTGIETTAQKNDFKVEKWEISKLASHFRYFLAKTLGRVAFMVRQEGQNQDCPTKSRRFNM